jgi:hypothetical protein
MLSRFITKLAMFILALSLAFSAVGCAALQQSFTKAPPASPNDPWGDLAGGFSQR